MKSARYLYIIIFLGFLFIASSCNDELDDELFIKNTYLIKNGWKEYNIEIQDDNTAILPIYMGVNGTSENDKDISIQLTADPESLADYNLEKFKNQTEYYYKELPENNYSYDKTSYTILKGSFKTEAQIKIDLSAISNIYEEYVLPIKINSSEGEPFALSEYSRVLARIDFKNRFSGSYSGTGKVKQDGTSYEESVQGVKLFGTSVNTCCFYAGNITRTNNSDFIKYMIDISIDQDDNLTISSKNVDLEVQPEEATIQRKYVKHTTDSRYYIETTTLKLKYKYKDQNEDITYTYEGTLTKTQNVLIEDYPNVIVEEY